MKLQIYLILVVAIIASSCSTQRSTTAKRMDIYGSGVIQYPIIAEMDVDSNKITGTADAPSGTSLEIVKNSAVADALKKSNADILIEPTFETITSSGRVQAVVTGFPASYKNFRPATIEDMPLLELGIIQTARTYEPISDEKRKSNAGAILGALGGIGLLVLLGLSI